MGPPWSSAQDLTTGPEVGEEVEEIIVTGTRIKRRDFVTASPITTINSADIAFSGQATVEEFLKQMPHVLPEFGRTANNPTVGPNPTAGAAGVDLRGLGPGRSLVLLNGRRVAPPGTTNGVDLNTIPEFLVERVEIISGGTSAVYGSDAIAGVMNFITKNDFDGFGVEAGMSMAEPGDAEIYDISAAYGHNFASGRGNLSVWANLYERKSLLAGEREFTSVDYWDVDAELVEGGSSRTPAGHIIWPEVDFGSGPAGVKFDPSGNPREFVWPDDLYNYQPINYLQIPMTRAALGAAGNYDLSSHFEGYVEASFIRSEPAQQLAPVPADLGPAETNLDNPVFTPETRTLLEDNYTCGPNLACFWFRRRLSELGPRIMDHERDYARMVTGIRGELGDGWEVDGWVTYTNSSLKRVLRNDGSRSRLQQGLLVDPATGECFDPSGGCVPLDVFGEGRLSAEAVEFVRLEDLVNRTERDHWLASVFVTGSPFDAWAGPVDVALGAEWRRDEISFNADDSLFTGDTLGYGWTAPVEGSESVAEIYAEAIVPLADGRTGARYLGLEAGVRYSDYDIAGGMWTYKAGGEWEPVDGLRFRVMHQRSARAPNSTELFEAQRTVTGWYTAFDTSFDRCSASANPVENGNVDKCLMQGLPMDQIGVFEATPFYPVDYLLGGNPDLVPETGDTWTAGFVFSPSFLSNWTLSADYFEFEVTDTIGGIDAGLICFDPVNTGNVFCENITRDATGNVADVTQLTSNRGILETTGVDVQLQYSRELPDWMALRGLSAEIDVNVFWTHMISHEEQANLASQVMDCAGYYGWPCDNDARTSVYPGNRVTSKLHYVSGPLQMHLTWRWIEGTRNADSLLPRLFGWDERELAVPKIGSEQYLDVGIAYRFGQHMTGRFGVTNLLDNDPPQMADAVWDNNTETGLYDVFGRSYYVRLSAEY